MERTVNKGDAEFVDSRPNSRPAKYTDPYESNSQDRPPGDEPPRDSANSSHVGAGASGESSLFDLYNPASLIQLAERIYTDSTEYIDTNISSTWETSLAHFHNEHASDTNYVKKDWRRSKIFRPKTRTITKAQEAAVAAAAFATQDYVDIEPEDETNEAQRVSAEVNKAILQYRLDRRLPWFQTVMGAFQDTKIYGICISHQYWQYDRGERFSPAYDDDNKPVLTDDGVPMGYVTPVVRADELRIDNVPPENLRFDPMADWRDPINTSPYLIFMKPMYAADVLKRMKQIGPNRKPVWMYHSLSAITSSRREDFNRTRQAREGDRRVDPADEHHGNEFTIVWAHMNIICVDGDDYVYWTLGTQLLLTMPVLLSEEFPHLKFGERPFTLGTTVIETHRNYPAGDIQQGAGIQREINSIANQRMDNVKLVLNKRYYVRRGSQVDLDALIRNVPGGGVMMNDPEKDVKTIDTKDVTSSSYQEQALLSAEMDELAGNRSQGEAQEKRNPGGTALGLVEMSGTANAIQDYGIRIFMETWMERTLRQAVQLIQYYETDEVILNVAAQKSQLWQRFGQDKLTDEILRQSLTVKINLGIGNTDPVRRVERLTFAVERVGSLPGMVDRIKSTNIANEIFGALGYKNSSRFFLTDEELAEKQAQEGEQGPPPEIAVKMRELDIREQDNNKRDERERFKLQLDFQRMVRDLALKEKLTLSQMYAKLGVDEMKNATVRDIAALKERNRAVELRLKRLTGSGI